jgi:simple sugar transport system ATP-binding protein
MVGGEIPPLSERSPLPRQVLPILHVRELRAHTGSDAIDGIEFALQAGEILGIAGVEGNGQTALADALAGVTAYDGTIRFREEELPDSLGPRGRMERGMQIIPQDRHREALVLDWSLAENAILGRQGNAELRRGPQIDREAARAFAQTIIERFDVRPPRVDARVRGLSGGNQQKVVVGRALAGAPKFVLAYQPTRGIDVGATALVQSRLIEARNAGTAILLISFELDEIFALADRVLVLYRGKIAGEFNRDGFDRGRIGALMAGHA